jgi:hypothetical protein
VEAGTSIDTDNCVRNRGEDSIGHNPKAPLGKAGLGYFAGIFFLLG